MHEYIEQTESKQRAHELRNPRKLFVSQKGDSKCLSIIDVDK